MSIVSFTFILFVIVLVGLYFLLPHRFQWMILLAASIVFYLSGGLKSVLYILVTIGTQYHLAMALERKNAEMAQKIDAVEDGKQKKQIKKEYSARKKRYVWLSVAINIGILCFLKLVNPAIESANKIFGLQIDSLNILLPIGLSYYTFKSVGYVIDVYRGRIHAQKNIFKLSLYIGYFPALVQGPIDRYEDLAEQLFAQHDFDYRRLTFGAQRMLWGYIKKLVIAERAAVIVNEVMGSYVQKGYVGFTIFFAVALYAFELYADFSGGMDIVNGLSEIFGISLTENFKRPFFATSVAEFWQRWHITLGAWMKTYVFYPLSLSPAFNRLGKKCRGIFGDRFGKLMAPSFASFITFVLIGMWHGTGWKYVLYGLYMAIFVSTGTLLEEVYASLRIKFHIRENAMSWRIFQSVRTFFVITLSRYVSLAKDVADAGRLYKATFTHFNPWVLFDESFYNLGLNRKNFNFLLVSIAGLMVVDFMQERGIRIRQSIAERNIIVRWCVYYAAIFALIIFGVYGPGYNVADFIYQRF